MIAKEMFKQSLPLLILCGIGGLFTGNILILMAHLFETIPGLIIIIPGVIALRGNISTAFGSRIGSAYHLGVISKDDMWNDELKQNIIGSIVLSILVSAILGLLAYITSIYLFNVYPQPLLLIGSVLLAGIISGFILTFLTVGIIYLVFKRGYDPDNITGPALSTVGDIITMLSLFISAGLMGAIL
ncbi:divalent cation transporter [Thermoplasmatales archaeon ex4572_165]|nr:MAG: divalent cation transporter [Thermoplasmatales archaeon ex4572_165]RLF59459.1 MAG: divalent cation transporter [Thermoplasmata archaeon]